MPLFTFVLLSWPLASIAVLQWLRWTFLTFVTARSKSSNLQLLVYFVANRSESFLFHLHTRTCFSSSSSIPTLLSPHFAHISWQLQNEQPPPPRFAGGGEEKKRLKVQQGVSNRFFLGKKYLSCKTSVFA